MRLRIERFNDLVEERLAIFSDEQPEPLYRFLLSIVWDRTLPRMVLLLLNPSKATHLQNDPTVERGCRRAKMKGFGGVVVLNAFAWRETDRLKMLKVSDPIGQLNDNVIVDQLFKVASRPGDMILVGWGIEGGHLNRHLQIARLLQQAGVEAYCLKLCANGQPGHPLYIGYDRPFLPWP